MTLNPAWGSGWSIEMPWSSMLTDVPGRPVIGSEEFPDPLPPLEHTIIGPTGASDNPAIIAQFGADEDVGFATLSGYVEAERVRDMPDIYTDGAQWIVTDSATGRIVSGGDLLAPVVGGSVAALKADGWSKRLQRRGERLLYAVRGYSNIFVPKDSEPYGPEGKGFYVQGEDRFQCSTEGALRWHVDKGTDEWNIGDQQGFVAAFEGLRPGIRRITGNIHCSFDGPNFRLMTAAVDTPAGPLPTFGGDPDWNIIHDFTSGGSDFDFSVDLDPTGPVICIEAYRTTDGATGANLNITMTNLILYGIALTDDWTASDIARDIAGRLGFQTLVDESRIPVLPLDVGPDGVYQDALDISSVLAGMFYRVVGVAPGRPALEMRAIGSTVWEVIDPEFPVAPVPLPRFDSILIPYVLSNGVATSVLEVTAEAIGQPMLPIPNAYGPVPLHDPVVDSEAAKALGQKLLELVYPPRFGGTVRFSRVLGDNGFATAHEVHAQDALLLPYNGGITLNIKSLRRSGGEVEATFDDGVAGIDRRVARYNRRLLLEHPP